MYTNDSSRKIDNWMSVIVKVFSFITLMHKEQSNLNRVLSDHPVLVTSQKSDNLTLLMKINSNFEFDIGRLANFIDEARAMTSVQ